MVHVCVAKDPEGDLVASQVQDQGGPAKVPGPQGEGSKLAAPTGSDPGHKSRTKVDQPKSLAPSPSAV